VSEISVVVLLLTTLDRRSSVVSCLVSKAHSLVQSDHTCTVAGTLRSKCCPSL